METYKTAKKHALKNKIDYGKADFKSVMSRVLFEHPEYKTQIKTLVPIVKKVVEEVNNMSMEEVEKEFAQYEYQEFERPENRFSLPDAGERVILRFAPEPSGYLHIGHAKALFINKELLDKYTGKFILRIDDTNPEKAKKIYEDAIKEDLAWLGVSFDEETHSSDYMPIFYEKARELISKNKMYLTFASSEHISEMRKTSQPLPERSQSPDEALDIFERAIAGEYDEGEVVALYKGDLNSLNTTMRDPTLFRVIKKPHYKYDTQYVFWPTYDFAAPILDSLEGVTHAIRSKEYELRTELYRNILKDLEMREPSLVHISRLAIKGVPVSKRLIRPLVEKGVVSGWDDIRLSTIKALRRRGIPPEAIKEFVLSFGMGKQEKVVEWDMLLKIAKKYVKPQAHILFAKDLVKLYINHNIKINNEDYTIEGSIYIDKRDLAPTVHLEGLGIFKIENHRLASTHTERTPPPIKWIEDPIEVKVAIPHELFLPNGEINPHSLELKKGYVDKKYLSYNVVFAENIGFLKRDNEWDWIKIC